jgi:hypothetical protein
MKKTTTTLLFLLLGAAVFAQGYRVNRTEERKKIKMKKEELGKNMITVSPLQLVATDVNEKMDIGVGLCYERVLDNELIAIKVPVTVSLIDPYVYFMPAIKIYPTKQGIVRYAIGPQFLIGTGNHEVTNTINSGGVYYQQVQNVTRNQFGFLLNHCLNFTVSRNLFMSMEAGIGVKYADNYPSNNWNDLGPFGMFGGNSAIRQSFQFGFQMGYRF